MIRSDIKCKGEDCDSYYIQNKKKHLCSACVFKSTHNGKSQQEVYQERSKVKTQAHLSAEEKQETHNRAMLDSNFGEITEEGLIDEGEKKFASKLSRKPIKQISNSELVISRLYKIAITNIDYTREFVCTGCLRYQGGDIKLSHSHIISRADCKRIGREDLISNEDNITFHCMSFGENKGCHEKWENPAKRKELNDYKNNINFIKIISEELYLKYSKHV